MKRTATRPLVAASLLLLLHGNPITPTSAAQAAQFESAASWRELAIRYADGTAKVDPDGKIPQELVYVLARAGDLEQANAIATQVTKPLLRVYAFAFVAKQYRLRGDQAAGLAALRQAQEVAIRSDRDQGNNFINSHVVRAYFEANEPTQAASFAAALSDQHQQRLAHQHIAAEWARSGELEKACHVMETRLPANWREGTLLRMARACAGELRIEDFSEISARLTDAAYRDRAHESIVQALVAAGREIEAIGFVELIADPIRRSAAQASISAVFWWAAARFFATRTILR